MPLAPIDWLIIVAYFVIALAVGLYYRKRAGESLSEFFLSGRSLPWWIAGTSMVATSFAADTPLAVTGLIARHGIAGNWFWWSFALGGMVTVFVYARLVLTMSENGPNEPNPREALLQMVNSYLISQALYVAAKLGIADLLADGPKSSDEIAAAVDCHPPSVYRLLRCVASVGVFAEPAVGLSPSPMRGQRGRVRGRSRRAF